ncbi:MAG: sodium-independent anion transporter, partial [Burkholderiales bacterium]|nr:sodium-independent anion transporter [Burkholderiales bacterium]
TFLNAGFVETCLVDAVAAEPGTRHAVLVMSSVNAVDSTALERLERAAEALRAGGVTLHLCDVKGPVGDAFRRAGFDRHLGDGRTFLSAHAAAQALAPDAADATPAPAAGTH